FIVLPLGAVLVESFVVIKPMTPDELRAITEEALSHLPPDQRADRIADWTAGPTVAQRIDAIAAGLQLIGRAPAWDRRMAYDLQIEAAEAALDALDPQSRRAFEEVYPVALIMLHKRIPLAFQVRDAISEAEFDALRTGTHETFGLDHYLSIFTEPRLARAARNSVVLALTTSGLTTTLAFLLAYGINRGGVPLPNLVRYGALTPLVSPPVMVAFAAILLFGREGLVTRGLLDGSLGWIDADVSNLYGIEGVIVAQTVAFLPAALIVLDNVLARHDAQLEEAAAIQGATSWQIFRRITVPLSQPGLMRAAVLVFVLSMTDFANPLIIGQDFPVLAGILYDEMIGFQNTRLSAALAIWLIVPAITVYLLLERVGRRKRFGTAGE